MTNDQIERLYMFIMFNNDILTTDQLVMILDTDLSKESINN
jgi:hypothetical protein